MYLTNNVIYAIFSKHSADFQIYRVACSCEPFYWSMVFTMTFKNLRVLLIVFLLFSVHIQEAFAAGIEWKLFLRPYLNSGPILTKTTSEGETFIFRESECSTIPSESHDIISALDGISFLIQQSPSSGAVSIHVILNVNSNTFEKASGVSLFINLSFEVYVNGIKDDFLAFDRSPLVMSIPQTCLNSLLTLCNLSRDDLICVYISGGKFTNEGIETNNNTSGITVKLNKLSQTVGGFGQDLGFSSKVKVDTWNKIKLLFQ